MVFKVPKTRPAYPDEFRREAVQMLRAGRTPRELAASLGVSEQTLRNWRRQAEADRRERTDVPSSSELEELRALRKENARLKQERDLLKRAAAFFAADSKPRGPPTGCPRRRRPESLSQCRAGSSASAAPATAGGPPTPRAHVPARML